MKPLVKDHGFYLIWSCIWIVILSWGHRDPKNVKGPEAWCTPLHWQKWILLKYLVLVTQWKLSVDNLFVLTTLITLIIVHFTSIFILPIFTHVKLKIYARLLCMNNSELILYVLWISYWWDIRAIYRQYFEILDVNSS